MEAALEYDLFRDVIKTPSYRVPATNLSGERYFFNKNLKAPVTYSLGMPCTADELTVATVSGERKKIVFFPPCFSSPWSSP